MKKVIFLTHRLHQYRKDFYELLKVELEKQGVQLLVIYSKSKDSNPEVLKKDECDLDWGIYIPIRPIRFFKVELYWQPVLSYLTEADLIIVQQANKLLLNYYLIFFRRFYKIKMAYWGHGLNMQLPQNSFANRYKKLLIGLADWWFAYTNKVKETVGANGFDERRITVVNNAIDTKKISHYYQRIDEPTAVVLKRQLRINTDNVGIFCGGIYKEKRIEFLIKATDVIKKEITDFQLIVIGSGPDETVLKEMIQTRDYIHFLGPKFHEDRVPYFKISKVFLMPGLVGLGILDSFALETPMITTDFPYHSPEIEYLKNGQNGIMTRNNVDDYAHEVVKLLRSGELLCKLIMGCRETAPLYSNERMVENFKNGMLQCLNS